MDGRLVAVGFGAAVVVGWTGGVIATCAVRAGVGNEVAVVGVVETGALVMADVLSGCRSSVVCAIAKATATIPIAKPTIATRSQTESRRGPRVRVGVGAMPL